MMRIRPDPDPDPQHWLDEWLIVYLSYSTRGTRDIISLFLKERIGGSVSSF